MWWNHNYKCKSETSCYTECSTDAELMPDPFGIVGEITLYWMFNWWAETCSVGHSYQLGLQSPLRLSPAGFGALLLINYTLSSTSWSSAFTTVSYYCCTFSEQWWEEEACFPWPSSCVVGCMVMLSCSWCSFGLYVGLCETGWLESIWAMRCDPVWAMWHDSVWAMWRDSVWIRNVAWTEVGVVVLVTVEVVPWGAVLHLLFVRTTEGV